LEDFLFKDKPTRPLLKKNTYLPLLVDASQEEAIRQIKAEKSFVVQGSAGTGKSQLISNLMTDYAANRKRVLLLCQKRAAIDVVYKRLREIDMENFAALVHDFRTALYDANLHGKSPKELYLLTEQKITKDTDLKEPLPIFL
jgi:reverse gyrase